MPNLRASGNQRQLGPALISASTAKSSFIRSPNETEISHGRVSWQTHWTCNVMGAVGFVDWLEPSLHPFLSAPILITDVKKCVIKVRLEAQHCNDLLV